MTSKPYRVDVQEHASGWCVETRVLTLREIRVVTRFFRTKAEATAHATGVAESLSTVEPAIRADERARVAKALREHGLDAALPVVEKLRGPTD